jgi:hypothetical protein
MARKEIYFKHRGLPAKVALGNQRGGEMKSAYVWPGPILAMLLAVVPGTASAQEELGFGSGVMTSKCSRLIEGMDDNVAVGQNPLAFAMLSWTEGYITAINLTLDKGEAMFDLNSLTGVELWAAIYGFCKRNPDKVAVGAVMDAMSKLERVASDALHDD